MNVRKDLDKGGLGHWQFAASCQSVLEEFYVGSLTFKHFHRTFLPTCSYLVSVNGDIRFVSISSPGIVGSLLEIRSVT